MIPTLEKLTGIVATILLFMLMILTAIDVAGRNLINQPLKGATELTEISLAVIIFLMLPRVALRNAHIVVDLIDGFGRTRLLKVLDALAGLVSATFFGLIAWRMWTLGAKAMDFGDVSSSLHIPLGPILYGISILSATNAVAHLVAIPRIVRSRNAPAETHAPQAIV